MISTLSQLQDALAVYDVNDRVFIDLETTSGDDKVEAFRPYDGHKTTLFIVGQRGKPTVGVPLRHQTEGSKCIEQLDEALKILAKWCKTLKILCNLNVKFDMHFMAEDGIFFDNAVIEDTGVLARLVYNEHPSYSLENLCKIYNVTQKAADDVKAWIKEHNTKDYGKIPWKILYPYGCIDVDANIDLHYALLNRLPPESNPVWDIERALTPVLFEAERNGIPIDTKFMVAKKVELLQSMIDKAGKIQMMSGISNPDSQQQIGAYFNSVGIKSNKLTDNGSQSWDKDVMDWVASLGSDTPHKVADLIYDYSKEAQAHATFIDGWIKHLSPGGIVHTNIKQAGTRSGRSSSEHPNSQNTPKWMLEAIQIPKGYVGVAWDMSQVEYRLFAHYAKDPEILKKYAENPRIDYHQILADALGIPRDPTKRINFGILYGMGKGKTTTNIRREVLAFESNEKNSAEKKMALREHLHATYFDPFADVPPLEVPLDNTVLSKIAENILTEYHVKLPSIKEMQQQIKQLLRSRGYIKGYYGRYFYLPIDKAYVGLNRVIQGTAADLFKKKMVELVTAARPIGYKLQLQIHDAMYGIVPLAHAQEYIAMADRIVCDTPFRVPILIDFDLALYNWKNKIKITKDTDVMSEIGKLCFL